jgi:hypothetical protein
MGLAATKATREAMKMVAMNFMVGWCAIVINVVG